jgi:hypothetical protein
VLAKSYLDAHRYDGAVIQHDRRDRIMSCVLQPRDLAIVRDVWRYKFLTAPQLLELWWPDADATWPGQRRLHKLFNAGYLERFRPLARRGSYPWTYHLGAAGHQLLQRAGILPRSQRHHTRAIYDYGHVLHELQLNAWVLAFRRARGNTLLAWHGELDIIPPRTARPTQLTLDDDWSAEDLRDPRARLLRPDAVLELANDRDEVHTILVEYDRTQRVDKNYDKFRRYDAFLCCGGATPRTAPSRRRRSCSSSARHRTSASSSSPPPITSSQDTTGTPARATSTTTTSEDDNCSSRSSTTRTPAYSKPGSFRASRPGTQREIQPFTASRSPAERQPMPDPPITVRARSTPSRTPLSGRSPQQASFMPPHKLPLPRSA